MRRAPPSRYLAATTLALAAEASAVLFADDADGGNSGVAIVGVDNDGDGATDDDINNNCDGATDDEVDDDGDGATGGRHCLDA